MGQGQYPSYRARELNERESDERSEAGFIYISSSKPWPLDVAQVMERLPDDWIEDPFADLFECEKRRFLRTA
jgi:hypothetical protein